MQGSWSSSTCAGQQKGTNGEGLSLECAALSALWYAAAWRRLVEFIRPTLRQVASIQSADKAAHWRRTSKKILTQVSSFEWVCRYEN